MDRRIFAAALAISMFGLPDGAPMITAALGPSATYYVDCAGGSDASSGTSEAAPWRTVARANAASVPAGGAILFRRGTACSDAAGLRAHRAGTEAAPVRYGAYGGGPPPILRNNRIDGASVNVEARGSHQVIEDLELVHDGHVTVAMPPSECANPEYGLAVPVGWYIGVDIAGSEAHHNTVRRITARGNANGAWLGPGSHHNTIEDSRFLDNVVLQTNTPGGLDDAGAFGVGIDASDDNVIRRNHFSGNNAWCSYDFGTEGASIEVYRGARNAITHNVSIDDKTFTEVGSDATRCACDNLYAYNVHVVTAERFARQRPESFTIGSVGVVRRTSVYHNSVYATPPRSIGVSNNAPGSVVRDNVIWAGAAFWSGQPDLQEGGNVFWASDGDPKVSIGRALDPTSRIADPGMPTPRPRI